jgi:hypothetical protein
MQARNERQKEGGMGEGKWQEFQSGRKRTTENTTKNIRRPTKSSAGASNDTRKKQNERKGNTHKTKNGPSKGRKEEKKSERE